jgi:hypothetical protein
MGTRAVWRTPEGNSSIGRASVSKTEGWRFKSFLPCSVMRRDIVHIVTGRDIQVSSLDLARLFSKTVRPVYPQAPPGHRAVWAWMIAVVYFQSGRGPWKSINRSEVIPKTRSDEQRLTVLEGGPITLKTPWPCGVSAATEH